MQDQYLSIVLLFAPLLFSYLRTFSDAIISDDEQSQRWGDGAEDPDGAKRGPYGAIRSREKKGDQVKEGCKRKKRKKERKKERKNVRKKVRMKERMKERKKKRDEDKYESNTISQMCSLIVTQNMLSSIKFSEYTMTAFIDERTKIDDKKGVMTPRKSEVNSA